MRRALAVFMLVGTTAALVVIVHVPEPPPPAPDVRIERPAPTATATPTPRPRPVARIVWRASTALGTPTSGRLRRGVRLPPRGAHFLTWDPVRKRTPNRWWRRYGTDALVRVLLRVTRRFARAHPHAPRVLIGDLSRPHGGDFGRRYGPLGHVSHQNGLDADVYFPRRDRRLRAPRAPAQVDRRSRRISWTASCGPARGWCSSGRRWSCAGHAGSSCPIRTTTTTCTCGCGDECSRLVARSG